jgi:hypothetical protein
MARMREEINAHKVVVGKPESKNPIGRRRRKWESNIKVDLKDLGRST